MMSEDQPLTPAGRLFLQPATSQIVHCAVAVEFPIDADAFKSEARCSIMLKNPRFCSLMVRDSSGREHWRRTTVDVDRHVIVHRLPLADHDEDAVNDFIADLSVSSPLATDKPLWEIHLLMAHNTAVFRMHHALGDGISLMSALMSFCRRADDPSQTPAIGGLRSASAAPATRRWSVSTLIMVVWYTLIYVMEFLWRTMWLKDRTTALSGGAGVDLWPRKLATARFRIDHMKIVKRAVAGATINDVLCGVISRGLSRYLDITSPQGTALPEGLRITGVAARNLRLTTVQDTSMNNSSGNKFGIFLLPFHYHGGDSDPIQFVKRAKATMDKKKLSLDAFFTYTYGCLALSLFGAKFASTINYRIFCNTTFTMSNVIGPTEKITLVRNPVKYLRSSTSSLPHAISLSMVSYAGTADLQILVAKEVIPDPKVLALCFEDALLDMKEAALALALAAIQS